MHEIIKDHAIVALLLLSLVICQGGVRRKINWSSHHCPVCVVLNWEHLMKGIIKISKHRLSDDWRCEGREFTINILYCLFDSVIDKITEQGEGGVFGLQ